MRLSLIRLALACLVLALFAGSVSAGPLGIVTPRGEPGPVRRLLGCGSAPASCSGCTAAPRAVPSYHPAPSYAAPVQVAGYYQPAPTGYVLPVSNCPNGRCPLPVK